MRLCLLAPVGWEEALLRKCLAASLREKPHWSLTSSASALMNFLSAGGLGEYTRRGGCCGTSFDLQAQRGIWRGQQPFSSFSLAPLPYLGTKRGAGRCIQLAARGAWAGAAEAVGPPQQAATMLSWDGGVA